VREELNERQALVREELNERQALVREELNQEIPKRQRKGREKYLWQTTIRK